MSTTTTTTRLSGLLGEGVGRLGVIGLLIVGAIAFALLPHVPNRELFDAWFEHKSAVLYITVLTILAAFLAAVLTIWTLMKTRASRYIERLADSAAFGQFIADFEVRLVLGCAMTVATGIVTVIEWHLTADWSVENALVIAWMSLSAVAFFLLVDSLMTARKLL